MKLVPKSNKTVIPTDYFKLYWEELSKLKNIPTGHSKGITQDHWLCKQQMQEGWNAWKKSKQQETFRKMKLVNRIWYILYGNNDWLVKGWCKDTQQDRNCFTLTSLWSIKNVHSEKFWIIYFSAITSRLKSHVYLVIEMTLTHSSNEICFKHWSISYT